MAPLSIGALPMLPMLFCIWAAAGDPSVPITASATIIFKAFMTQSPSFRVLIFSEKRSLRRSPIILAYANSAVGEYIIPPRNEHPGQRLQQCCALADPALCGLAACARPNAHNVALSHSAGFFGRVSKYSKIREASPTRSAEQPSVIRGKSTIKDIRFCPFAKDHINFYDQTSAAR